jgi:hypothetical protein
MGNSGGITMTYKEIGNKFWKDDLGVIWETIGINVSDWSFELQKVNFPEVRKQVHGSKFESNF